VKLADDNTVDATPLVHYAYLKIEHTMKSSSHGRHVDTCRQFGLCFGSMNSLPEFQAMYRNITLDLKA